MRPAFSVVFLTTLIGVGQGLFVALYAVDVAVRAGAAAAPASAFFVHGAVLAAAFTALGLVASFFHLGRPERAWRTAAMWRTSWLSREVIALPSFLAAVVAWGVAWHANAAWVPALGALALAACIALFACTGMVYAGIRFLQEWASPLTLANFALQGCASGTTLATAYAAWAAPSLVAPLAMAALVLTLLAWAVRGASLVRNARLAPRSTLQTAIGVAHPRIRQTAQGFIGDSFNTREFFHRALPSTMRAVKWGFLAAAFALPILLVAAGLAGASAGAFAAAFAVQYAGLIAERWYFLAQANHPQNLYYQAMS
ncbi:MAG: DmsC/YnfH family molybdoenzyme membrane anchor subunit [Burkholderiales bacterium]